MCARNFLSARDKNASKVVDSLPNIKPQKYSYRTIQDFPTLATNSSNLLNRNLSYSCEVHQYVSDNEQRAGTPFSDFFSGSEAGTPDFHSEESDSSAGSVLRRNTAEATKFLYEEWEKIERTLYDEEGEKSNRPLIIEECKQWRQLHPHLRIVGKAISLPEKRLYCRQIEHDEIVAMQYTDYEIFSESEERLSQSSTDVTPQNSPRVSFSEDLFEPKLSREKVSFNSMYEEKANLSNTFCSLLQITPIQIRSPLQRKRQNSSILKSEIASSRWMRNCRPDSSMNVERNSAKSFVSLDIRNSGNSVLSASEKHKMNSNRILTARQRDVARLEPLYTPDFHQNGEPSASHVIGNHYGIRKVSLPPLLLDEEKKKVSIVNSAKKHKIKKSTTKTYV